MYCLYTKNEISCVINPITAIKILIFIKLQFKTATKIIISEFNQELLIF